MKESSHLPVYFSRIFEHMAAENSLSEREKNFFTDSRLFIFWRNAGEYLSSLRNDLRQDVNDYHENVASFFVGSFICPLAPYGKTGTKENPSPKIKILTRMKVVDQLLNQSSVQAESLYETLRQLDAIGEFVPSDTILNDIIGDAGIKQSMFYPQHMPLHELLVPVVKFLKGYERLALDSKKSVGMKSNKSTWRDWLAEAKSNIDQLLITYPGELKIREADWVALAKILIDENISRESVRDSLRKC